MYNLNNLPKISIITPSFNQVKYLENTIQSVVGQGYPNLEYIIIDGGSTDGSIDVIRKYEKHLTFWCSEPDGGLYDALQKGFEKSTGDIMAWLNSDDMYHRRSLFVVAEIFSQFNDIQWLTGVATYFNEEGNLVNIRLQDEAWSIYRFLLRGRDFTFIQQESTFWRRSLWERSGNCLSTHYALAGDFELWRRFFQYEKLYTVHTPLAGFRFRTSNQKSLEQRDVYNQEMELIRHQYPLSKKQFFRLKLGIIYRRSILRFLKNGGVIRKITKRIFDYPPTLFYNRFKDCFEWSKYF